MERMEFGDLKKVLLLFEKQEFPTTSKIVNK